MTGRRTIAALAVPAVLAGLGLWQVARAEGGVFTFSPHGDPSTGVRRIDGEPIGDCAQCHDQHASREGVATAGPFPYLLFAQNDNRLCSGATGCHAGSTPAGVWPGPSLYDQSLHAQSSAVVWPGPDPRARPFGDAGYCVNCHDAHGRGDGFGLIPSHAAAREEALCLPCHDASGPATTDIASEISKTSRHPATEWIARHGADEGPDPAAFGQANRHAECADCHNPHDVRSSGLPANPPDPSPRTQRVSRVSVSNRSAGLPPTYIWRSAADAGPVLEYEICFKCHSSWTTLPPGQPDLALLLNSNNPSFHPVEAEGRDTSIDPQSFVGPWRPDSRVACGDCHGSDDDLLRGPHGSIHDDLLRRPYVASSQPRTMSEDEICFSCHRYDVYAERAAPRRVQQLSRWNPPASESGHTEHASRGIPCYSCHDSHGSGEYDALIVTGRVPGLNGVVQSMGGGTCATTCHGPEGYSTNYPR